MLHLSFEILDSFAIEAKGGDLIFPHWSSFGMHIKNKWKESNFVVLKTILKTCSFGSLLGFEKAMLAAESQDFW